MLSLSSWGNDSVAAPQSMVELSCRRGLGFWNDFEPLLLQKPLENAS